MVNFDEYPFPARHLLSNELYYSFTSQRRNFTILVTGRGCRFNCRFCAISRVPYQERSPENVLDEIEECYRDYNIREIDFFDPVFFINRKRSSEICEGIINRGIKIEWSCRSRIDTVDEGLLKLASKAGCKKIYYGIESVSMEVQKKINKNLDTDKISEVIALSSKYGINSLGFFMVGNPGDTDKSILSTIDFSKRIGLDFIQVCRTIAKPNTDLNDELVRACGIDHWREYVLGNRKESRLPMTWSYFSEDSIERYTKRFYREFYFRPSYIMRRLRNLKTPGEFFRYARVAVRWFCHNTSDVRR
jgi:radical SAM superfamily enzyme YgiQ (UPF0313 family)